MSEWLTPATITAIIGSLGVGGFIVALLTLRPTRQKISAEANKSGSDSAQIITATAVSLLEPLRARITELEKADTEGDKTRNAMREDILILATHLKDTMPEIAKKYFEKYDGW